VHVRSRQKPRFLPAGEADVRGNCGGRAAGAVHVRSWQKPRFLPAGEADVRGNCRRQFPPME
jgi:hypothetical protein